MKHLLLALSIVFVFNSCEEETKPIEKEVPVKVVLSEEEEMGRLNEYMDKYKTPPQSFVVSSEKSSTVKGEKGSVWHINPKNLETISGKPITSDITVELLELQNVSEFWKNNVQTVTTDGQLLASGGSYYIDMKGNGEQLKLKEGKSISTELPKISKMGMELFYGSRDELERMNWEQSDKSFKTAYEIVEEEDTASIELDGERAILVPAGNVYNGRKINDDEAVDSILSYIEGQKMTEEEKKNNENYKKAKRVYKNMYQAMQVRQLGWINVDRFLKSSLKPIYFTVRGIDSATYTKLYIVFKEINSMMIDGFFGDEFTTNKLPVGQKIKVVALGFKSDQILLDTTEFKIVDNNQEVELVFQELKDQDVDKLF